MGRKVVVILSVFFSFLAMDIKANDPQFTQFYAAPLYMNPAFAGAVDCWRAGLNYRNQWFLGTTPYSTYKAYVDHNLQPTLGINGGAGMYVFYDNRGAGDYTTIEIAPMISYKISLNEDLDLRFGLQPSYHFKYANGVSNVVFGDQIENLNGVQRGTSDNLNRPGSYNFFDLSSGALLYSKNFWLGLSAHHMLRNSFMVNPNTNLVPMRISIHTGYKIDLSTDVSSSLSPAANFRTQGANMQLDLGAYWQQQKLILGMWYRGIPLVTGTLANSDALAFLVGFQHNQMRIGYSYDLPLSKLINSFGTHELSLVYEFCFYYSKKQRPPANVRRLPCPQW